MDVLNTRRRRRDLTDRLVFVTLLTLLAAFVVWCLTLLWRAERLRDDLDIHFGWIDEVRAIHGELEELRGGGGRAAGGGGRAAGVATKLDTFLHHIERLADNGTPQLAVTLQRLRDAKGGLSATDANADDVWQAAVATLAAIEALEEQLRGQVSELHAGLGAHWHSLYILVFLSLALAASNFVFLLFAHRRRRAVEEAHAAALEYASHDALTGQWNREGILRLLSHELVRAQRSDDELGVILVDIDHFGRVNEAWGQDQGDYVLEQVAQRLQKLVRPYDNIGRYGGDSFLLVLPSCDTDATELVASRILSSVNGQDVEHAFGHIRITLSLAEQTISHPIDASIDHLLLELHEQLESARLSVPSPAPSA
jgi:diguanylate cyclase (GGDEF)-like protein